MKLYKLTALLFTLVLCILNVEVFAQNGRYIVENIGVYGEIGNCNATNIEKILDNSIEHKSIKDFNKFNFFSKAVKLTSIDFNSMDIATDIDGRIISIATSKVDTIIIDDKQIKHIIGKKSITYNYYETIVEIDFDNIEGKNYFLNDEDNTMILEKRDNSFYFILNGLLYQLKKL
ncbi:MAG: hypothetical protein IJ180_02610 [Bacteroidales bacterium]|nr:hypothetical protein [Bacteroidales bacterium]